MPLVDLKVKREEAKETSLAQQQDDYPYGVKLRLEEDEIEKLGLDKLPTPGNSIGGEFIGMIESASINKGPEGTRRSLCIQIVKLGLGKAAEAKDDEIKKPKEIPNKPSNDGPSVAKVLYGD